ncbi:MAG: GIY-YIG nuclease family protein [Nitrospinae bacterium]|nr:GIY-YIG nuclease family protein [Nitrospinota bacterium]
MRPRRSFYVYLMTNPGNTVLYTGMTGNLARRAMEHQKKAVEGFTKTYNVTKLVYAESCASAYAAKLRERQIKGWRREKKNALVNAMNPAWEDLSRKIMP